MDTPRTWRPPDEYRWFVPAFTFVIALVCSGGGPWFIALIICAGGLYYWFAVLRPYVRLGSDLTVQNLTRTSIPLPDVMDATPGYWGMTITYRRDGRTCTTTAWAVQKTNWSKWNHEITRADQVSEDIRSAAGVVNRASAGS